MLCGLICLAGWSDSTCKSRELVSWAGYIIFCLARILWPPLPSKWLLSPLLQLTGDSEAPAWELKVLLSSFLCSAWFARRRAFCLSIARFALRKFPTHKTVTKPTRNPANVTAYTTWLKATKRSPKVDWTKPQTWNLTTLIEGATDVREVAQYRNVPS